jgi:hypothetical protein
MASVVLVRFAKGLVGFGILCLLLLPLPASADDVIPVSVNGSVSVCQYSSTFPYIGCTTGPLAGSFTFDVSTNSVVGPWSIDWVGVEEFSSVGDGPAVMLGGGTDLANDEINFAGILFFDLGLFQFPCDIPSGTGYCQYQGSLIPGPTPEPSALLLLATGLVGLGFFTRRFPLM